MDTSLPADLIDFKAACRVARASLGTLHRWRLAGKIHAWRRCGRWFVSESELRGLFVAGQPAPALHIPKAPRPIDPAVRERLRRRGVL